MFQLNKSSKVTSIPAPLKTVVSTFTKSRQIPANVLQKVCAVGMRDYAKNADFDNNFLNVDFEGLKGAISTSLANSQNPRKFRPNVYTEVVR